MYWSTSRPSSKAVLLHTGHLQVPRSQLSCRYDSRSKHYREMGRKSVSHCGQDREDLVTLQSIFRNV